MIRGGNTSKSMVEDEDEHNKDVDNVFLFHLSHPVQFMCL